MSFKLKSALLTAIAICACSAAYADDHVFARQGDVALTHAELDAAFAQIPEKYRMAFIRNGAKVDQLVQSLLRYKQIANAAKDAEFDQGTIVKSRMALASEKELSQAWLDHMVSIAPEADYEALAHEKYLANPELFQSGEEVDVTHILIKSDIRPNDEALAKITALHEELVVAPERFDEYVLEYTEDPAVGSNQGHYRGVTRGQMIKPFEDQAFSMTEPGSISEPVKTAYGYHIIRLDERRSAGTIPFEQVKAEAIEQVRQEHLEKYRRNYIISISSGQIEIPDGAVEEMAKRHFGENLELSPDFYEER